MSFARYFNPKLRPLVLNGQEPAWLKVHPRRSYIVAALRATPPWVDRDELQWIHWCVKAWSAATKIDHVCDHIIPLTHPHVSGLSVPWNLRIVTRAANATKSNNWHPDQMALAL